MRPSKEKVKEAVKCICKKCKRDLGAEICIGHKDGTYTCLKCMPFVEVKNEKERCFVNYQSGDKLS